MEIDSNIIRTEIIRILNESGKLRGNELLNRVLKKTGSEKMIYREISSLVESGEVEKRMYSKSHIEYELINLSDSVNEQLKSIHNDIAIIFNELEKFEESNKQNQIEYQDRLRTMLHFIQKVQSTNAIITILARYPSFKNDKMFSQITRKISDCWERILQNIAHQNEERFLDEIIINLRSNFNLKNVN